MLIQWILWFAIGAFIGSFLNVAIYRLPRDQSVNNPPRSYCPHCKKQIAWYDNVPILSYLNLGAKCRHCRKPIHWRYPVVEIITGLATVAVFHHFGVTPVSVVYAAFVWALIAASAIDLEFQIIPDEISLGGLVVGLLASALVPQLHGTDHVLTGLLRSFIGALVGGGILYVTGAFGTWLFKKDAMGGGDVKLLAMAGSILGWKLVVLTFFLAPVLAIVPGLLVLMFKKSHEIPYGPFLAIGLLLSLFAGQAIIDRTGIEETIRLIRQHHHEGSR